MGSNSSQTIGHKYKLGMHAVICQSDIDGVVGLTVGDKTAWGGFAKDQTINVSKPSLFGGDESEGGVSGYIDVLSGSKDQGANEYLSKHLEGEIPGFRGVVSLVFRKFYWGNNPYIKPWSVKVQNVQSTFGSWLPQLAPIRPEIETENTAFYIALDDSGSMGDGNKLETMKEGIRNFIAEIPTGAGNSVAIVLWAGSVLDSETWIDWDDDALSEATSFVNGASAGGSGTNFNAAVSLAAGFFDDVDAASSGGNFFTKRFKGAASIIGIDTTGLSGFLPSFLSGESEVTESIKRKVVFVTDGEPFPTSSAQSAVDTLADIEGVSVHGINIVVSDTSYTEMISSYDVPVIDDGDSLGLTNAIASYASGHCDINPIHIIRDVLVSPSNNGLGDDSIIGESFETAAQTLFDEGLGLSFDWGSTDDVDSFIKLVEGHINASTFISRSTGAWEIKLIRDDYVLDDLPVFDASVITEWPSAPTRADQSEMPNYLTMTYTSRDDGSESSISLPNLAGIQVAGRVIPETFAMEGITHDDVASIVVQRELQSRTVPIWTGAFRVAYLDPAIDIGSAIVVNEPRLRMSNVVCRVAEIEEGNGKDNSVMIRFSQDVYSQDMTASGSASIGGVSTISKEALNPNIKWVEELPYYEMVQILGEDEAIAALSSDIGAGLWGASCDQPNQNHTSADVVKYESDSYLIVSSIPFLPTWTLTEEMTADASENTFQVARNDREFEVAEYGFIQINSEIMRVDSIVDDGDSVVFTVGRGVLDTVPQAHKLGAVVMYWSGNYSSDGEVYTDGETVETYILPKTSVETLPIAAADETILEFSSRAARPYPAGNLKIDGEYTVSEVVSDGATATWSHRNRLTQTTAYAEDFTASDITPEDGVSYRPFKKFVKIRSDFFSVEDIFGTVDFFADENSFDLVEFDELPATGPAEFVFSASDSNLFDRVDFFEVGDFFFASFSDSTAHLSFGVTSVRGDTPSIESWQSPEVKITPLLPPMNFKGY